MERMGGGPEAGSSGGTAPRHAGPRKVCDTVPKREWEGGGLNRCSLDPGDNECTPHVLLMSLHPREQ
jgi:hypothetical protein